LKAQFYFTLDIDNTVAQQILNVPKIASAQFVSPQFISHVECIHAVDTLCEKLAQQVGQPKKYKWVKILNPIHIEESQEQADRNVWKDNVSLKIFLADIEDFKRSVINAPLTITICVDADPEIVLH